MGGTQSKQIRNEKQQNAVRYVSSDEENNRFPKNES